VDQANDKPTILFMVVVMAFAIVLVDDRWIRVGLGLLPALLLAQRAMAGSGVGSEATATADGSERRTNDGVREKVAELLKLIREFYTTCHMVAVGQLEPSKAKAKAAVVERRLNQMMAEMLEEAEGDPSSS